MSLGAICQADDYQHGSHLTLGPDGQLEGPGGSHQRAVEDDVGLTSYVRRQELVDIELTFKSFSSTY